VHVATITLDPAFRVAPVDRRLFGTFVEHMGRCVYTGIYEPEHDTADDLGFRRDVADLVRTLGPTVVRYPGGNFVSSYRWEDGVGPRAERPQRLDLAWRTVESNEVGVDEFVGWSRRAGMEPIMAVNLGTRGVQEAADLLEYCNHPGGTRLSDLRRVNGSKEPHDIRMWCLGNELDGPWQVGHKTAQEYGRLAAETARAMRMVDPRVELVACGSSNSAMPTFAAWEREVLEHCYDLVDHVSLHTYYDPAPVEKTTHLASSRDLDRMITTIAATADHVGARLRSRRRLTLAVDEWNVWYQSRFAGQDRLSYDRSHELIEDVYDVYDAVVVGSLLITLLRHADRVAIGCQAQLVNVIAPILTRPGGGAWAQTIFHPFAQAAAHARGEVLRVEPQVATYEDGLYGDVPLVEAVATLDDESGTLTIMCVNRSLAETVRLEAGVRAFPDASVLEATALWDDDPSAHNTEMRPDRVAPRPMDVTVEDGIAHAHLPPVSWAVIRLQTTRPTPTPHVSASLEG
jgi:alpha-N-arabinofuranosidase